MSFLCNRSYELTVGSLIHNALAKINQDYTQPYLAPFRFIICLFCHPLICCSLRIPYKQVLRAGCPALVDSYANIVKVASSNPVAARVFLHNRLIALIRYQYIYPSKSLSSDQNAKTGWNAGTGLSFDGSGVGQWIYEGCLLTCLQYTPLFAQISKTVSKVLSH